MQNIQTIHSEVIRSLDRRELKATFEALAGFMTGRAAYYLFVDELNGLQDTYRQLLFYYTEGSMDPMQTKIYNELTASAYELADRIKAKSLAAESTYLYYSLQRTFNAYPKAFPMLTDAIVSSYETNDPNLAETQVLQLFNYIWVTPFLREDESECLYRTITEDTHAGGENAKSILNCQIVSSLMLGLQEVFDKRKMLLLLVAAESDDPQVQIRAYTGILITLFIYRFRTDCYPEIKHRLDTLAERPEFRKIICPIILQFILSRETEKISNKLQNEFIPEMLKLNPKFNPRTSFGEFSFENPRDEGMNPEWMDKLSSGKLGKQIEEFNRLQEEGADVMHSTFTHLKRFPFFNETGNWFMPFFKNRPALPEEDDALSNSFRLITEAGFLCNSDLYSLYFSIRQIPEAGRKMMLGQLESQLSELKEKRTAELQTKENDIAGIIGQYTQDLYRFYKLHPHRNQFKDVFALPLDFHNLPVLQEYFSDPNDLLNIADLYLRKNYFDDALRIYDHLSSEAGNRDDTLYQKTGYCRQMNGHYDSAIAAYEKAELINPESKWLLRHTAQCYRAIKKPEMAIGYYLQCEKLEPENFSVLLSIGSCYLDMKNYAEALRYYFKVDYLDSNGHKARRPIAWCSFLTGKYDQARHYYLKILSGQPDAQDYMNAGHTEWALQNIKGALEFYKKSVEALSGDYDKFRLYFNPDVPRLTDAGIDETEIPLILDQLCYRLTTSDPQ
jgi:tetratricopeptide (TPR) repeat protein